MSAKYSDRVPEVNQREIDRLRHNRHRMKVLEALRRLSGVGREVDYNDLFETCALMGAPMVPDQLDFHLGYLEEWNWVCLRRESTKDRVDAIVGVTLTAAGLDRIDIGHMPTLDETQQLRRRR